MSIHHYSAHQHGSTVVAHAKSPSCPPSPVPLGSVRQEYASNTAEGWRAKDCAVYLVMAVTVKGRMGEKGATTLNRLVNISDFFTQQVRVRHCSQAMGGTLALLIVSSQILV